MKPLPPRNEEPRALTSDGHADVAGVPVPLEHQGGGGEVDGDVSCLLEGVAVVPGAFASETERVCHGGFESLGHVHQSQLALGPQRRLGVALKASLVPSGALDPHERTVCLILRVLQAVTLVTEK